MVATMQQTHAQATIQAVYDYVDANGKIPTISQVMDITGRDRNTTIKTLRKLTMKEKLFYKNGVIHRVGDDHRNKANDWLKTKLVG